jgi:hypothetical protein
MKKLQVSCEKATVLIEQQLSGLPPKGMRQIRLALHYKICSGCLHYYRQSKLIDTLLKETPTESQSEVAFNKEKLLLSIRDLMDKK